MNSRYLWHFLEKWTRPDDEAAMVEWKQDLDEVFYKEEDTQDDGK